MRNVMEVNVMERPPKNSIRRWIELAAVWVLCFTLVASTVVAGTCLLLLLVEVIKCGG